MSVDMALQLHISNVMYTRDGEVTQVKGEIVSDYFQYLHGFV